MNNRNQNQARLPVEPAASPTYLNVFTVEEYESNGKAGKRNGRPGRTPRACAKHGQRSAMDSPRPAKRVTIHVLPPDNDDRSNK